MVSTRDPLSDVEWRAGQLNTELWRKKRKVQALKSCGISNKELRDAIQRHMRILEDHTRVLGELIDWVFDLQECVCAIKPGGVKLNLRRRKKS